MCTHKITFCTIPSYCFSSEIPLSSTQFPGSPDTQHPGKSKLLACESLGIRQLLLQPTQFPGSDTMIPSWLLYT